MNKCLLRGLSFGFSTVLAFSFLSPSASATNIRVIGNAGGEEAMMDLTRYSILKDYLRFCLLPGNPCEITSDQLSDIAYALGQTKARDARNLVPEELLAEGLSPNAAMLLAFLASADGGAGILPLEEYPTYWRALAEYLFKDLKWTGYELYIASTSQRIRAFEISGRLQRAYLFAENEENHVTENLTSALSAKIPCTDPEMKVIGFGEEPKLVKGGFSSQVRWQCREGTFAANFAAVMSKAPKPNEAPTWDFTVFGTHLIEPTEACEQALEGPHNS